MNNFILLLAFGLSTLSFSQVRTGSPKSVFGFLKTTTIAPVAANFYEIEEFHLTLGIPAYRLSFDHGLIDQKKIANVPVLVHLTGNFFPAPQAGSQHEVKSIEILMQKEKVKGTLSMLTLHSGVKYQLNTTSNGYEKTLYLITSSISQEQLGKLGLNSGNSVKVTAEGVLKNGIFAATNVELDSDQ